MEKDQCETRKTESHLDILIPALMASRSFGHRTRFRELALGLEVPFCILDIQCFVQYIYLAILS